MRGKFAMSFIAALLLLATVGGTASAAPPSGLESYDAGADGVALDIQVGLLDLQIAAGTTSATATSQGPAAKGDAVGVLLAGTEQTGAHAAAPDGSAAAEDCAAAIELPPPLDLTDGTCIAGVSASANADGGAPAAAGASDSLTLSVGGAELTEQLLGALPLDDVLAPLGDILAQLNVVTCTLNDLVGPLLGQIGAFLSSIGLDLTEDTLDILCSLEEVPSILGALLDSLGNALSTTVTVTLAPNSSYAGANDADGVVAAAVANGLTIDVLPGLGPDGTSFLEVIVGSSEATVVRNATTGEVEAVAAPAELVGINVNGLGLGGLDLGLGALTAPIVNAVNQLIATLADASPLACGPAGDGGLLAGILCLDAATGYVLDAEQAAAEGYDFGPGTVGARTSALRVELLSLLNGGQPAVSLSLAEATAAANATPAGAVAPPTSEPPITRLPKTGSSDLTGIVIALGLGLGAVAIRVRRRAGAS